jgi:hypothetical protein
MSNKMPNKPGKAHATSHSAIAKRAASNPRPAPKPIPVRNVLKAATAKRK